MLNFRSTEVVRKKHIYKILKEEITSLENFKFSYRENKLLSGKLARRKRRLVRRINFCNYYLLCVAVAP